jgi:hypothetical protein
VKNSNSWHGRKGDKAFILAGILLCGCPVATYAGDLAYGLGYGSLYRSNIAHVAVDPTSEWTNSIMAGIAYVENTPDLQAHALGEAYYLNYKRNTYANETLFNLDSAALWNISPQRFTWMAQDVYTQLPLDVTTTETPANRQNVNVFQTGPEFQMHFSPVQTLVLGARYGSIYTSGDNTDNDRYGGYSRWQYQSTPRTQYSLNYEAFKVWYKDTVDNTDYTQQNLYVRADTRPSRSQIILDLGATRISRDQESDVNQNMGKLSWLRQVNPETSMGAYYSVEISNTANDILAGSSAPPGSPAAPPPGSTSDIYTAKRSQVFYSQHSTHFGTALELFYQDLDYQVLPDDNKQGGGNLGIDYYATEVSTITLYGSYAKTKYTDYYRNDIDRDTGLRFSYLLGRNIELRVEGQRLQRASTSPSESYVDNRLLFTVMYTSNPLYRTLSGYRTLLVR